MRRPIPTRKKWTQKRYGYSVMSRNAAEVLRIVALIVAAVMLLGAIAILVIAGG